MSAANFCTMRDFPLYAKDYYVDAKRCPECEAIMDADATECECCECGELEDFQYYDDCAAYDDAQAIERELIDINHGLMFHEVKLQSGYYYGVQFYVEVNHDLTEDKDYTNDDCHYYFDCCRSVAYRKYEAEMRKTTQKGEGLEKKWGRGEWVGAAIFPRGGGFYFRPSTPPPV